MPPHFPALYRYVFHYNSYLIKFPVTVDKAIYAVVQYSSVMQNNALQAAVAQSVERRIGSAEVTGPIPVSSFKVKSLIFPRAFLHLMRRP